MKTILFAFQQVGGANALLPLIETLKKTHRVVITGRPAVCGNLVRRGVPASEYDAALLSGDVAPIGFGRIAPDLVITDTIDMGRVPDGPAVRDIWRLAADFRVPSAAYMDCWWGYDIRFRLDRETVPPVLPGTVILVDDDAAADLAGEDWFPDGRSIVLGSPRFAGLKERAARCGILPGRSKVRLLFVSQPLEKVFGSVETYGYTERTALSAVLEAISGFPEDLRERVAVDVLLHPEEDESIVGTVVREKGEGVAARTVRSADPVEAVLAADLVVGMFSILLAEAVVLGRPVVSVQPHLLREEILITNRIGATTVVTDPDGLPEVLAAALFDPDARNRLLERQARFRVVEDAVFRWTGWIDRTLSEKDPKGP